MNHAIITVENVSKTYVVWSSPAAWLHGSLLRRVGQLPFLSASARAARRCLPHESFRQFHALRGISLEVHRGNSIGIIGRNGSGKSTLLQILAGTLQPTAGAVTVNGSVAALLELGSGFDHEFTGRENVYLGAAIRGLTRRETDAKFEEIAEFADIGDFMDQPVRTYSSGMLVRLAFAVSACMQPEVLIVDEALSVGDIFFQQKCIRHMTERMRGVTKVLVTHDIQAVLAATEYVYVLDGGEIAFAGPTRDAVQFYVKMSHDHADGRPLAAAESPAGVSADVRLPVPADLPWCNVKAGARSGIGDVRIERFCITDAAGRPIIVVKADDRIVVRLWLACISPKEHTIVGYLLSDRVGNVICGENTCSVPHGVFQLAAGEHLVQYEFAWPAIRPGEYTITLGVGEGTKPLGHLVQCWVHDAAKFVAVSPGQAVHGFFNNALAGLRVAPLGRMPGGSVGASAAQHTDGHERG